MSDKKSILNGLASDYNFNDPEKSIDIDNEDAINLQIYDY